MSGGSALVRCGGLLSTWGGLLVACMAWPCAAAEDAARAVLMRHAVEVKLDAEGFVTEARLPVGAAVPEELTAALGQMSRLERLSAAGTRLNDAAVAAVGRMKTLRQLDLRDCPVTNAGLAHLSGLTGLVAIRLSGKTGATTVDDAGMPHLAGLKGLRVLMLDFLWVGKDGLETLAGLDKLEELTLAQTLVQDDASPTSGRG